jgi:hypothetical protein
MIQQREVPQSSKVLLVGNDQGGECFARGL